MNEVITLKGLTEVDGMKFHDIEGGFGTGKKAMLAKDIAAVHGRDLFKINEDINRNRVRFKDGVDVIDLQDTNFVIHLRDNGIMSQNAINRAKNIYLVSERGYAKLLKILEDEIAWEQYEKLVDGYFNLRAAGGNPVPRTFSEALRLAADLAEQNETLQAEYGKQAQLIGELQPKADYVDYILSSTGTVTISQIAADYGISAQALNKILHAEHIQHKVGGQWILYKEHMGSAYTKSETVGFNRSNGTPDTKLFTRWTQKGRLKINEVLNQRGIYAVMELIQGRLA